MLQKSELIAVQEVFNELTRLIHLQADTLKHYYFLQVTLERLLLVLEKKSVMENTD